MNLKVEVEVKTRPVIAICSSCSEYGHTKAYCSRTQKCGKCGEGHAMKDCDEDTPPNCPKCGGPHPITYRGCTHYRDAEKKILERQQNSRQNTPQPRAETQENVWFRRSQNRDNQQRRRNQPQEEEENSIQGFINGLIGQAKTLIANLVEQAKSYIANLMTKAQKWAQENIMSQITEITTQLFGSFTQNGSN